MALCFEFQRSFCECTLHARANFLNRWLGKLFESLVFFVAASKIVTLGNEPNLSDAGFTKLRQSLQQCD
jgi:hypothetical protein